MKYFTHGFQLAILPLFAASAQRSAIRYQQLGAGASLSVRLVPYRHSPMAIINLKDNPPPFVTGTISER